MPETARLLAEIEAAAACIAPWRPLHTMIAINPLQGLEDLPFEAATAEAARLFGGRPWPDAGMVAPALADGRISAPVLTVAALRHGRPELADPDRLIKALRHEVLPGRRAATGAAAELDRLTGFWLAAFLDQGQASWPMPDRELGFYRAWRRLARHDRAIPERRRIDGLPDDPAVLVHQRLAGLDVATREGIIRAHLVALPGWVAHLRWRVAEGGHHPWNAVAPASLLDYVAVRLALADLLGVTLPPVAAPAGTTDKRLRAPAGLVALEAWEESHRQRLLTMLTATPPAADAAGTDRPLGQIVLCIDVRSEVLRRHLEATGPWETLGFAGFFGVPVAVRPFGEDDPHASCPVLLRPRHLVDEHPLPEAADLAARHLAGRRRLGGLKSLVKELKAGVAGSFGYIEATGLAHGAAMMLRTLTPRLAERLSTGFGRAVMPKVPVAPGLDLHHDRDHGHDHHHHHHDDAEDLILGLSPAEQAFFAEGALRVMGLTKGFAELVVFCGHGGHTVNNVFASGLDCGACGGNRGGPNARILAALLNAPAVRAALAERGILIPKTTRFLSAEHDTTTDRVSLDPDPVAASRQSFRRLQADLDRARRAAAAERVSHLTDADPADPVRAVEKRAADWSEVRPEWALAGNAAFIVGDRALTRHLDLGGRTFLHSYDWQADADGRLLEVILTAPMVVAEWINTQYLFSTLDNDIWGAGSKTIHDPVAGLGVLKGNGPDLAVGLPLQSVMVADGQIRHEPLRLMAVVQAPRARVEAAIERHAVLSTLFDNGWVALAVLDPETGCSWRRDRSGAWLQALPERLPDVMSETGALASATPIPA